MSLDSCHLFPVLKQNVGSQKFKGVCDVETCEVIKLGYCYI